MALQLRDNLHWCNDRGRAVFLDVDADRYFCLPAAANEAFLGLVDGELRNGSRDCPDLLRSSAILTEVPGPAGIAPPPRPDLPANDLCDEPCARASAPALWREFASELIVQHRLRRRGFAAAIRSIRRDCSTVGRPPAQARAAALAIAAAARTISYVMPAHDRCLVRALAVHHICTRRGLRPALVFGVVAHPFAAHCWVQLGRNVIVGGAEQARLYTPILVLE